MRRNQGFTLIEMMVVVIIIVIVAGTTVALMNTFFRGQGVRQAAQEVRVAFSSARQLAADQRVMHFLVFYNKSDGGIIEIHKDADQNRTYNGDKSADTNDQDPAVPGSIIELPKFVQFKTGKFPDWVGINPTGYCIFPPGFSETNGGIFDGASKNGTEPPGDVILEVQNKPYLMCLDIDRGSGKIRQSFFLNTAP